MSVNTPLMNCEALMCLKKKAVANKSVGAQHGTYLLTSLPL